MIDRQIVDNGGADEATLNTSRAGHDVFVVGCLRRHIAAVSRRPPHEMEVNREGAACVHEQAKVAAGPRPVSLGRLSLEGGPSRLRSCCIAGCIQLALLVGPNLRCFPGASTAKLSNPTPAGPRAYAAAPVPDHAPRPWTRQGRARHVALAARPARKGASYATHAPPG